MEEHGILWVHLIPGLNALPEHVAGSVVVLLILSSLSLAYYLRTRNLEARAVPKGSPRLEETFDALVGLVDGLAEQIIGERTRHYLPLLGALFLYILFSNLIGLIPGFIPPTSNISTNFGMSLVVFVMYNAYGFKENGVSYLKHFMGPILVLSWLMFPIEVLSHLVRPVSLAVRLMGNMFGDHMVLSIFSGLIPIGIPVIFIALGAFVAVIQALVFTLLSTIYIALSTTHDH